MQYLTLALYIGVSAAQSLTFPAVSGPITGLPAGCTFTTSGNVNVLARACNIPAGTTVDLGNREFDRGVTCNDSGSPGPEDAVFILGSGATLRNAIIGVRQLDGVHCSGACTVRSVWFRDVCEDAISATGSGDVLITGGGAQNANDKVVQHNGPGRVTIENYTVVNVGKLYRSCGNCGNNQARSPRQVTVTGLRANGIRTNVAGINSNFGDSATISGSCGTVTGEICQQFNGVNPGAESPEIAGKQRCLGAQGALARGTLPRC
ncbi:polysaccharide lyase family 3 protein [Dothidotthia symphoricarpi CBS 119687]|uniref:Pectate lyase n=1 Tax=Dothidotthia symphoricarpi CBS 119687 TaxID=1392245 RepID=A0A6A6A7L2_9PLEO|nr:polysaccharide lyase family 3 protein [Dothidotthia symphoricarpi CBS 119687]KAF2127064.1 polysaccharide lyase family 3 protein [Dothidotthia symphoricarpi CBS 119687]